MMTRSSRRRLKRFLQSPFNILAGVFTIVGTLGVILITAFEPSSSWLWAVLAITVVGLGRLALVLYREASKPQISYFEEISFGVLRDTVLIRAVQGLINFEKAKPEFVYAAPTTKEVEKICLTVCRSGFATIYGGPGEGKSMAAYHAAYRLYRESAFSAYVLRGDLLSGRLSDFQEDLEGQLDDLKPEQKLLVVDDAQKLHDKTGINRLLRDETSDGNFKVIWIETDFYQENVEERPGSHVRINFQDFAAPLVAELYQRKDFAFEFALRGQIEGLDDALDKVASGQIRDAWHFAFVASCGEKKIANEISKFGDTETLVLFLISAYTVTSGERELSIARLMNLLERLTFGWLKDALRKRTLVHIVQSIRENKFDLTPDKHTVRRIPLVRIYDKTKHDRGYVASLHYNSAEEIVRVALLRASIAEDLIQSLAVLLTQDIRSHAYLAQLLWSLGTKFGSMFVKQNENWFVAFLSDPPEIAPASWALVALKTWPELFDSILGKLDLGLLARRVSTVDLRDFHSLATLLNAFGYRRDELLASVVWKDFARRAEQANVDRFAQIADLLNAIRDRRDELADNIDLKDLAERIKEADASQFTQVADLLNALGQHRDELAKHVDWKDLAGRVEEADASQFSQIADLLNALGQHRDELVEIVIWKGLTPKVTHANVADFGGLESLLHVLKHHAGQLLTDVDWKEVAREIVDHAELADMQMLGQFLYSLEEKKLLLAEEIQKNESCSVLGAKISEAPARTFEDIALFLSALDGLLPGVDVRLLVKTASECTGDDIKRVTTLMAVLDEANRSEFLTALDWPELCMTCPIKLGMLRAFGRCLGNAWAKCGSTTDSRRRDEVARYLWSQVDSLVSAIEESYLHARTRSSFYAGIATFLSNCGKFDDILALQIAERTLGHAVRFVDIRPDDYYVVGDLINALFGIFPDLARTFIDDRKVRGKITDSINDHAWTSDPQNLAHLVKSIYGASKEAWSRILKGITVDLAGIDLQSIYAEVTRE